MKYRQSNKKCRKKRVFSIKPCRFGCGEGREGSENRKLFFQFRTCFFDLTAHIYSLQVDDL